MAAVVYSGDKFRRRSNLEGLVLNRQEEAVGLPVGLVDLTDLFGTRLSNDDCFGTPISRRVDRLGRTAQDAACSLLIRLAGGDDEAILERSCRRVQRDRGERCGRCPHVGDLRHVRL